MDETCAYGTCAISDALGTIGADFAGSVASGALDVAYAAPWFWPLCAAIVGAVWASFAGVVVDRLPRIRGWNGKHDHSLSLSHPGSHCDHCGRPLSALDLIPVVGWAVARGRCSACGNAVAAVYPAVEAGSALVSLGILAWFGPSWLAVATCIAFWLLLLASWIDVAENEIPDIITVPLFFLGLLGSPFDPDVVARGAGAAVAGAFMWLSFRVAGAAKQVDAMSYGDIALVTAVGAWVGLCGVPYLLLAAPLIYVAYALPFRRKGIVWVPMGPAIAVAAAAVALFGLRIG